ncbi:UDP-N-acetylmuramoyl-tripeptide--D-alanyl-D-alanine ligase [Fibrobacter sp. UWB16]|uniref:UDP-N-acetylmuramoyl-tripeptide--D-alanyl-D- alanine ligase n=1 Tax=Fibrobacter sp. UWB16 TaxID=1945874 RepID=UPI000BC88F32|nr:UDP-N-acetylmuramoyl-tripeptide--D-alanyl-D-alanine ligase [Fibrobacter sp. UWB16]SOD12311.1 UDP-N-acetylmuramoyl-tripeptide--D-alanyl-D-alanine ligase [Fibrobacter sp. UWB16]
MLKLDLTIAEMLKILETEAVGVPARTLKRKVNLCMDSRESAKGVVFWPIKGARFDAHQFVSQMEKDGALMSVVNQTAIDPNFKMYAPVEDTTKALLKLAKGYQRLFKLKKVAITGSNGKTTTKEMTKAVLSMKFNTHATKGNFNNHIGVPMTLFQLKHSHEAAVVEMGTSGPDEIRPLSLATEPDIAVITNIGASHLERLGDLDGVFNEKINIVAGLKKGGTLIVNADDERLCKVKATKNYKVVTFGVRRGVVKPEKLKWTENLCADFYIGRTHFVLNVPGDHNLYDALAAIAVGEALRIPKGDIAKALAGFTSTSMRMEIKVANGFKVISDCYNANPSSTKMALQTLGNMKVAGLRIAVLGDMLELGKESGNLHKQIGAMVPEMNFDLLLAVGKEAKKYVEGAKSRGMKNVFHFDSVDEAVNHLSQTVAEGDVVLVKGSRGMHMEQVVDALLSMVPVIRF